MLCFEFIASLSVVLVFSQWQKLPKLYLRAAFIKKKNLQKLRLLFEGGFYWRAASIRENTVFIES